METDPYLTAERQRADFISILRNQIGRPYIWAAQDPRLGFDCSGLIVYALKQVGFSIRDMNAQGIADYFHTHRILEIGKPGELCFYGNGSTEIIHHVMAVLTTWGPKMPILIGARGGSDTTTTPAEAYKRGAMVCCRTARYWHSKLVMVVDPFMVRT